MSNQFIDLNDTEFLVHGSSHHTESVTGKEDIPAAFFDNVSVLLPHPYFIRLPISHGTRHHNQVEAARDLGSPWWRIHFRVVMPHAKPGIASGCTMVFMLCAGALAAPQILGGPSSLWFTQIIYQWFNTGGNWPQGSAYAFVLLVSCIIFVRIMMRVFNVGLGDIARR